MFGNSAEGGTGQKMSWGGWVRGKGFWKEKEKEEEKDKKVTESVQRFRAAGLTTELMATGRNSVAFRYNATVEFPVEVVQAMILEHIKKCATVFSGVEVKDVVVTVPGFATGKERQAVLDSAALAGFNVLGLINENTAAAVQYAVKYEFDVNKTANIVIYNMGASFTQVSLFRFSAVSKVGRVQGNIETLATAYDETLGGMTFDLKLAEEFLNRFAKTLEKKKITREELLANPRVITRLRDTANRIKEVLSANKEAQVYTESLYKELDFVSLITQEQFNTLVEELYERVTKPLEKILAVSQIAVENIDHFVLIGGGVRIPRIQALLKNFLKRDYLDQNLNGDEAAAFGAAFRAANLSSSFRVRNVGLTDITPYAIGVRFHNLPEETHFSKRASVFSANNPIERKKIVSFYHSDDVIANVFYDSVDLLPLDITPFIANYSISGIKDVVSKNQELLTAESQEHPFPKISFTFYLNPSSILELISAEASIEELIKVPVKKPKVEVKKDNSTVSEASGTDADKSESVEAQKVDAADVSAPEKSEEKETIASEVEYTTRKKTHRFPLQIKRLDVPVTDEERKQWAQTLRLLTEYDDFRRELKDSYNALESYLYVTRDRLASVAYDAESDVAKITSVEQRATIQLALDAADSWLQDHGVGSETTAAEYRATLAKARVEWDKAALRIRELQLRPDAIANGLLVLNATKALATSLRREKPWLNETEFFRLDSLVSVADEWLNEKIAKQAITPLTEEPIFYAAEVAKKLNPAREFALQLQRRIKPLAKEDKKPKAKSEKKSGKETGKDAESEKSANKDTDKGAEKAEGEYDDSSKQSETEGTEQPQPNEQPESKDDL